MTDDLEIFRQTFDTTEETYDTEPVVNMADPLMPRPTPGFFRRRSHKAPAGQERLFDSPDRDAARSEYD